MQQTNQLPPGAIEASLDVADWEIQHRGDFAEFKPAVVAEQQHLPMPMLEAARRASARVVNSLMTATYWEIGRRIVEREQAGQRRADYGTELIQHLSKGLTKLFGRGFGVVQLSVMRQFFLSFSKAEILQSVIEKFPTAARAGDERTILQSSLGFDSLH